MGELGESALEAPPRRGHAGGAARPRPLFALGHFAGEVADAAVRRGHGDASACTSATTHEAIAPRVHELLPGDDWVLVKGSRSMKMERVVEALAASVEESLMLYHLLLPLAESYSALNVFRYITFRTGGRHAHGAVPRAGRGPGADPPARRRCASASRSARSAPTTRRRPARRRWAAC